MNIAVRFDKNDGTKPENLLAEAAIHFLDHTAGPFAGLKLVGFSVWRSNDGSTYVTMPARAFGTGQERRYFDYIRSIEGNHKDVDRLKEYVSVMWQVDNS